MGTDHHDHEHHSDRHGHDHHTHRHGHSHQREEIDQKHSHGHGHRHGVLDPSIASSARGLWAVKWSFIGLMATAIFQVIVVAVSGSVALLADTIHNFADAATAIPLGIAFLFARKRPSRRFTFGYGRVEDLAGLAVLFTIFSSAVVAGYESIDRFLHPRDISYLWAVALASIVGFLGNEGVALFRIRVGREIASAALIADGYHARVDGWTSLAVLAGATGVWLGYPLADPMVGFGITIAIFGIVIQQGKEIFTRMLDGVDPALVEEIRHTASHMPEVKDTTDVRARWLGHRLHAEINIAVDSHLTVAQAHSVAAELRHRLLHALPHLSLVVVHVDPVEQSGERHHHIDAHSHDGLPTHAHAA
jgi:cation diffusion facilitator family transporter